MTETHIDRVLKGKIQKAAKATKFKPGEYQPGLTKYTLPGGAIYWAKKTSDIPKHLRNTEQFIKKTKANRAKKKRNKKKR